ncbi:hypothetical protein OQA88_5747 [Cercophora sp. LCS_1]
MSETTPLSVWEGLMLPGLRFAGAGIAPRDSRIRRLFESKKFSSPDSTEREVIINNCTVLFRAIIWHKDIRGGSKFAHEVLRCMHQDTGINVRYALLDAWAIKLHSARKEYLLWESGRPVPANIQAPKRRRRMSRRALMAEKEEEQFVPSKVQNRFPGGITEAEKRLLVLID